MVLVLAHFQAATVSKRTLTVMAKSKEKRKSNPGCCSSETVSAQVNSKSQRIAIKQSQSQLLSSALAWSLNGSSHPGTCFEIHFVDASAIVHKNKGIIAWNGLMAYGISSMVMTKREWWQSQGGVISSLAGLGVCISSTQYFFGLQAPGQWQMIPGQSPKMDMATRRHSSCQISYYKGGLKCMESFWAQKARTCAIHYRDRNATTAKSHCCEHIHDMIRWAVSKMDRLQAMTKNYERLPDDNPI